VSDADETLLRFPCTFPIKAMGPADSAIEAVVIEIVHRHAPRLRENAVRSRRSRGGKWLSVTVEIEASSKAQLDAIYQELTDHELIVYAL